MKLSTFSFQADNHWSISEFPKLDSEQTLVIVFAAAEYMDRPAPLYELAKAYPRSRMIGCSTAGEIAGPFVNDASISVAVVQFEHSSIEVASSEIQQAADSFSAGAHLAGQLQRADLTGVFVLSDGLHVNGSELVRGLNSVLPPSVVVTGALAGDGDRFQRTWVIRDRKPETGVVTATGFYGESLQITHGSHGGWNSFGPERRVTRSQGNVLYELDGRPALALYKEYLGKHGAGLPATAMLFPLSIRQDATDSRQLVRTILAVDETSQSMTFAGDIPKGYLVQLMRANFDRLLDGASIAANQATDSIAVARTLLAIAVSCVGRRLILGERTEEETETTLENLPAGTRQIGLYSYGEIAPYVSGACELHNQTMTLTTFSEA